VKTEKNTGTIAFRFRQVLLYIIQDYNTVSVLGNCICANKKIVSIFICYIVTRVHVIYVVAIRKHPKAKLVFMHFSKLT